MVFRTCEAFFGRSIVQCIPLKDFAFIIQQDPMKAHHFVAGAGTVTNDGSAENACGILSLQPRERLSFIQSKWPFHKAPLG
ncbi:hypothetical protein ASPCADRAFT_209763 [Aspergillus carbonarius ITEM 5010]|uniref:Uncharacterized protein n=1 Tax=Aspergillus carbonarius (strain ITEM 5010) TaxID=602072 RepID=A0A1R3RF98_ASPC5|nr:hypothetical protein ASPCADRAFT_209763 [Aspergillus carbonarius ITEM 5010]